MVDVSNIRNTSKYTLRDMSFEIREVEKPSIALEKITQVTDIMYSRPWIFSKVFKLVKTDCVNIHAIYLSKDKIIFSNQHSLPC